MKTYMVSYYLGDFLHTYLLEAENMCSAIEIAKRNIPDTSKSLVQDFEVERYFPEWN